VLIEIAQTLGNNVIVIVGDPQHRDLHHDAFLSHKIPHSWRTVNSILLVAHVPPQLDGPTQRQVPPAPVRLPVMLVTGPDTGHSHMESHCRAVRQRPLL
jgi:hypothetical protein